MFCDQGICHFIEVFNGFYHYVAGKKSGVEKSPHHLNIFYENAKLHFNCSPPPQMPLCLKCVDFAAWSLTPYCFSYGNGSITPSVSFADPAELMYTGMVSK